MIEALLVDGRGRPVGSHQIVSGFRAPAEERAGVVRMTDGFLVAWQSGSDLFARRLDGLGMPVEPERRVDGETVAGSAPVAIAATPDGAAVVAWTGRASAAAEPSLFARRLDRLGAGEGEVFELPGDPEPGDGLRRFSGVRLAVDAGGDLLAVWAEPGGGGEPGRVMGRIFEGASGLPVERPFRIDDAGGRWPEVGPWAASGAQVTWLVGGAGVERLLLRPVLPPSGESLPRAAAEVHCRAGRLLEIGLRGGGETGEKADGNLVVVTPSVDGAVGRNLMTPAGEVDPAPTEGRNAWLWAAESSRELPAAGRLSGHCGGDLTVRDLALVRFVAERLRPAGSAAGAVLAVYRGSGVDTVLADLVRLDRSVDELQLLPLVAHFDVDRDGTHRALRIDAGPACAVVSSGGACAPKEVPLAVGVRSWDRDAGAWRRRATLSSGQTYTLPIITD